MARRNQESVMETLASIAQLYLSCVCSVVVDICATSRYVSKQIDAEMYVLEVQNVSRVETKKSIAPSERVSNRNARLMN